MDVVLKDDFPNSEADPFLKTSEVDTYYNCIAWAAGDSLPIYPSFIIPPRNTT